MGLLFARMREMGLFEDTWIVFTSDHGDMLGDHHLGAKSVFLEGSAHVPLIVRPPDCETRLENRMGQRCEALATLADILPTILARAGIAPPQRCDGIDLIGAVRDAPRTFFGKLGDHYFAAMEGGYKYFYTAFGGGELLFFLPDDPLERRNLAALPQYAHVRDELRQKLITRLKADQPAALFGGDLPRAPIPEDPYAGGRWPGFHSRHDEIDVLH